MSETEQDTKDRRPERLSNGSHERPVEQLKPVMQVVESYDGLAARILKSGN